MKKGFAVAAVVVGGIAVLGVAAMLIMSMVTALSPSASIGIIGGADGPTAIMVSGPTMGMGGMIAAVVIGILLFGVGIWGLRKIKK